MKENIVREKSYAFALRVIDLTRWLRKQREYEIAGQLLRAGTSIGANVEEALAGISRPDFIAKMSIVSKEAREAHYWLRLVRDSKIGPCKQTDSLLVEADELLRILTAIVKSAQSIQNSKSKIKNSDG